MTRRGREEGAGGRWTVGYDIRAYIPLGPPDDPRGPASSDELHPGEIAYLEMAARAGDARLLFEVLDAVEHDCVVSGGGIGRYFGGAEVREALRKMCAAYVEGRASVRTLRFLAEVVDRLHERPWVYIDFG